MRLSYSGWSTHNKCPAQYKYSYIDKLPRGEMGDAAKRGTEIHDGVEAFLTGATDGPPMQVRHTYGQWLDGLRRGRKLHPELKWAVTPQWQLTDFDNTEAAWRGVMDLYVNPTESSIGLDIYEWKTGQIYPEHALQAELYGTIGLTMLPEIPCVTVTNVYFDKKKNVVREYKREDEQGLRALWNRRSKDVARDTDHSPNPGMYCRWCDFSRAKGGPCQF